MHSTLETVYSVTWIPNFYPQSIFEMRGPSCVAKGNMLLHLGAATLDEIYGLNPGMITIISKELYSSPPLSVGNMF